MPWLLLPTKEKEHGGSKRKEITKQSWASGLRLLPGSLQTWGHTTNGQRLRWFLYANALSTPLFS